MARFQRGSVRVESRKNGPTWVLRYFVTRPSGLTESRAQVRSWSCARLPYRVRCVGRSGKATSANAN